MATEFKLSYTGSEVNKKLEKIDSLVQSVNGFLPDENGNVKVDAFGCSEKWETIIDYTVPEDCSQVLLTTDINGNPFSLKKAVAYFVIHPIADPSAATALRYAFDSSVGVYYKQYFWSAAEAPKNAGKATACRFELTKTNEGVIATTVKMAVGEFPIGTDDVQLKSYTGYERFHQGTLTTYATGIDAVGVGSYKTAVGAGTRIKLLGVRE